MKIIFFALLATLFMPTLSSAANPEHERLRVRNTFTKPEDVVRYYCGRDASGFIWSGLLDIERQAFTLWHDAPSRESFLIAKNYDVKPAKFQNGQQNEAIVEVTYDLAGMGDTHGTVLPAPNNPYQVIFSLKKVAGLWKIEKPESNAIAPVVVESKFPTGSL